MYDNFILNKNLSADSKSKCATSDAPEEELLSKIGNFNSEILKSIETSDRTISS